jgi:hypothetical protein
MQILALTMLVWSLNACTNTAQQHLDQPGMDISDPGKEAFSGYAIDGTMKQCPVNAHQSASPQKTSEEEIEFASQCRELGFEAKLCSALDGVYLCSSNISLEDENEAYIGEGYTPQLEE